MRTIWKSNEYEEAYNSLDSVSNLLNGMVVREEISSLEFQILSGSISQLRDAIEKHGSEEIE